MPNHDVTARKTTEAQLIDRALHDPAFRAALVADPKAVLARELGVELPDSIDVQVLQETASSVYLVLPPALAAVGSQLSEAELERVAGGGWSDATPACATCDNSCNCPGGQVL